MMTSLILIFLVSLCFKLEIFGFVNNDVHRLRQKASQTSITFMKQSSRCNNIFCNNRRKKCVQVSMTSSSENNNNNNIGRNSNDASLVLLGLQNSPFGGIKSDFRRRIVHYTSDWKDGVSKKTLASLGFLYFACLAPCIAFGGLTNVITEGSIGVVEFLVSCGVSGIVYSIFSGQPMSFLGPTGLTLAFISALYRFTVEKGLPFLPLYSWTGMWTSLFLALAATFNLSDLMRFCTRFTDDCFNALLAFNFVFQAARSILTNFTQPGADLIKAFASFNMALATWQSIGSFEVLKSSNLFNKQTRKNISDFGPTLVIIFMTLLSTHPYIASMGMQTLNLPRRFVLAKNRPWIPDLLSVPIEWRFLSMGPALLLTMLFYLDQNISIRTVNNAPGLKKGSAFHWDLLILSGVVGTLSMLGLPCMCGATVQSMNHVRSMSDITIDRDSGREIIGKVKENRLSGLLVHSGILSSLLLLPILSYIPLPVVSGIFLFIGFKLMRGNYFLERLQNLFVEPHTVPSDSVYRLVSRKKVISYISIQATLLSLVWYLKENAKLSLFFPSCIAIMVLVRWKIIPLWFSGRELQYLDPV